MKYQYGFIGAGNMASALASGLVKGISADGVAIADVNTEKVLELTRRLGAHLASNEEIAANSRYLVLAVKPQVLPQVLPDLAGSVSSDAVIVTMAAGTKMENVCGLLEKTYPVIRIMPNTPCSIGQGTILVARNEQVTDEQLQTFLKDFSACGVLLTLDKEEQIDSGSVISGCGPAYIYMYIDALAKAGEALGLDYETAATLAKATCRGAAALSEESPASLEELRVAVCSPGGSTIEGVRKLWDSDLDGVVKDALNAAYRRTKELSGESE